MHCLFEKQRPIWFSCIQSISEIAIITNSSLLLLPLRDTVPITFNSSSLMYKKMYQKICVPKIGSDCRSNPEEGRQCKNLYLFLLWGQQLRWEDQRLREWVTGSRLLWTDTSTFLLTPLLLLQIKEAYPLRQLIVRSKNHRQLWRGVRSSAQCGCNVLAKFWRLVGCSKRLDW